MNKHKVPTNKRDTFIVLRDDQFEKFMDAEKASNEIQLRMAALQMSQGLKHMTAQEMSISAKLLEVYLREGKVYNNRELEILKDQYR